MDKAALDQTGKAVTRQEPLSAKTVKNIHGIMSKALSTAVDVGYIKNNPAERATLPLGHATATFTLDVYGHTSEKMKEDSAARMQAYIENMASERPPESGKRFRGQNRLFRSVSRKQRRAKQQAKLFSRKTAG